MAVVFLTGSSGAIGKEIALGLARAGCHVIIAARDSTRGQNLLNEIQRTTNNSNLELELVDLSSTASMVNAIKQVSERHRSIDVLLNCASVVPTKREESADGIEMQFAVNVYAYWVLTHLLQPLLSNSTIKGGPRVINVASNYAGHYDENDLEYKRRKYSKSDCYQQSKAADRILTWATAQQFPKSQAHACHPGVVTSALLKNLGMPFGMEKASSAAATPIFLATAPVDQLGQSGQYWQSKKPKKCGFAGKGLEKNLWQYCQSLFEKATGTSSSSS